MMPPSGLYKPTQFFDQPIQPVFDVPPAREKCPGCPDGFIWNGRTFRITERLAEWSDFVRRGRSSRNMRPSHAAVASTRGSLGVGRFYFRVRVDSRRIFELYYDRAPQDSDR